jgi:hypothetical protein
MKIKISPSSLLSKSWDVLTNNNNSKQKCLINTIYEGLPEGENHFSIFVPGEKWILVRCTHDRMELKIYKDLRGHSITVNNWKN